MIPACLPPRDVSRPKLPLPSGARDASPAKLYGFPN
jgi:hypothetical protein